MTPEKQRIAIAEFCGWKLSNEVDRAGNRFYEKGVEWRRAGDFPHTHQPLPDYLNDLNAIHEAEELIKDTLCGKYNAELFKIASGRNLSSAIKEPLFIFVTIRAIASQRAEALLSTIGRWEDGKP